MIWSLLYSGFELLKTIHSGNEIHWLATEEKRRWSGRLLFAIEDRRLFIWNLLCSYGSANSRWRVIKFENWYAYWISRFVLTAFVSFAIVCIGQMLLKDHKRLLRYIGFV